MRRYLASLLVLVTLIVIIIPALMVRGCTVRKPGTLGHDGSVIKVFNHMENRVQPMEIEEYLKGVVAAEMPASFEMEALKAQAILARTYVMRRLQKGIPLEKHPDAVISTDANTCQAWVGQDDLKKKWGIINYLFNWNKVTQAVELTRGQVLTYRGELAEALYHSNAGGQTEDAANVWGNSVPYLKSVPSVYDQEAPNYKQEFSYTWNQLDQRLDSNLVSLIRARQGQSYPIIGGSSALIEVLEVSPGQRILQIRVGKKILVGKDFRAKLGLPSNRCTLTSLPTGLKITTYGNGHGVGMSQYGANGMAKRGNKYLAILHHYFPGALLGEIK